MTDMAWSAPHDGLRLGVGVDTASIDVALENVGAGAVTVLSHVAGIGVDLDWHAFELEHPDRGTRTLRVSRDRNRSVAVRVGLGPGARVSHCVKLVELCALAARQSDPGPLAPGTYRLRVVYSVASGDDEPDVWIGELASPQVTISIP